MRNYRKHFFSYLLPACETLYFSYKLVSFSISLVSSCLIQLQTTSYTRLPLWCQVAHVRPQNCLSFTLDLSQSYSALLHIVLLCRDTSEQDSTTHGCLGWGWSFPRWLFNHDEGDRGPDCLLFKPVLPLAITLLSPPSLPLTRLLVRAFHHQQWQWQDILANLLVCSDIL